MPGIASGDILVVDKSITAADKQSWWRCGTGNLPSTIATPEQPGSWNPETRNFRPREITPTTISCLGDRHLRHSSAE